MRTRIKAQRPIASTSDLFTTVCKTSLGVQLVKEFKFHETRRWRFDYAMPELKIAIEIDGGVWVNGRHNRPAGFLGDLDKFNAAASLGWVVLKFTPQNQLKGETLNIIRKTIQSQKMKAA